MKRVRAVVGILIRENKVLVAQRPEGKPYSGYWEFPGGKIELSETPLSALKRELLEELGIEVVNAINLFEHIHDYPDKTVVLDLWRITSFNGEPQSNEQQVLRWATYAEMLELNLLEGNLAIREQIHSLIGD